MRVAVIDLGTNTFNLLIVESKGSHIVKEILRTKIPVRIGKNGLNNNRLSQEGIDRAKKAIITYKVILQTHKPDKILIIGTSALRSAKNGPDLAQFIEKQLASPVEIIGGLQEAQFIFTGVMHVLDKDIADGLIMDIGGGSVEFILFENRKVKRLFSEEIGISRLADLFGPSDPIKQEQLNEIKSYLQSKTKKIMASLPKNKPLWFVGSSGSFDTFADIIGEKNGLEELSKNHHFYPFDTPELTTLIKTMIHSTKQERLNTPGLIPMRVDMIVLASILIETILDEMNFKGIALSTFAVKEGKLLDFLMKNNE